MNRHALVGQDLTYRAGGRSPQMRAALGHAIQKFSQHFIGGNQVDFPKRPPSGDYLGSVLIARVKRRTQ